LSLHYSGVAHMLDVDADEGAKATEGRVHLSKVCAKRIRFRRTMMAKAIEMRPGATAGKVAPTRQNTRPVYLAGATEITELVIAAESPEH
jgi:hypothetical protein